MQTERPADAGSSSVAATSTEDLVMAALTAEAGTIESDTETVTPPEIGIRAEIAHRITFATHQCDVPIIADLVISNPLGRPFEDLTLHLTCEPKAVGDRVWTIDRIDPQCEFRPRDRRVSIAGGMLDGLTERLRAEIRLELRQGDTVLAESVHPIMALARNEWGGARYMPELLAAFVAPNDPAIQRLLKEASNILAASGKRGSLEGYQAKSRTRSWEIVAGIWSAVSMRGLTYAEPPASFGLDGQKIRLPSAIEEHALATCLDTALLFAAAIEQAGLYPAVVFTEGHALAGAWLQPQSLAALTVDDSMEIRKAIDQRELVLFETTMATGGHVLPFSKAAAEGRRQVDEANEDAFIYAIDIRQARGRDIQPLSGRTAPSSRDVADMAAAHVLPPLDEAPDLPPFDAEAESDEPPATPEERLERWKRSLLDLSKRNRLLNLRPSATAIPIFCPDPAGLEDKIASGQKIRITTPPERRTASDEPDPTLYHLRTGEDFAEKYAAEALARNEIVANVDAKTLEKGVIELYRKAKADFEEGGSNTLFLALGMLRWSPTGDTKRSFRAPLIMLPVRLERSSARSKPMLMSHEDEPVFNLTLLQMLRQDLHIEIPKLAEELPTDASGVDVRHVWEMVRARVRDVPGFEVVEEVVLSTFSFAKYLMWKDLADRTETLKTSPFVRHVIDTPREPYQGGAAFLDPRIIDRKIHPSEIMAPLNADSSQIVSIHASGQSGDFVLEGPPGTGKSETIGNIIAHNLGLGRRVLFVSEKMAALDVVFRRLDACGLGDFCLELHSARANKRAVLDQLGSAWEKRSAHSVEDWQKKAERLAEVRAQLNGLVAALHAPGPGGVNPRDAVGRSLRYGDVHRLRLDWERDRDGAGRAPTPEALHRLEDLAKRLGQQFSQLLPEDLDAFARITHADWSYGWQAEIVEEARALAVATERLVSRHRALAERLALPGAGGDSQESAALAAIAELVPDCAALDLRFALEPHGRETMDVLEELRRQLGAYRLARKDLSANYPDDRIPGAPFQVWIAERERAEARMWPMRAFARKRLRKMLRARFGLDASVIAPEGDLETLRTLAGYRAEMDRRAATISVGTPWCGLATDADTIARAVASGRRLREAATRFASFGRDLVAIRDRLAQALCDGRDMLESGMPMAAAARDLAEAYGIFADCLARFRATSGLGSPDGRSDIDLDDLATTAAAIIEREKRLKVWCSWVEVAREAREEGLGALVPALERGAIAPNQAVEALRTAYACWLAPILIDARPELTRFSAVRHEDLIRTFRELDHELAALTAGYIRAKLSGNVPSRDAGGADPGYGVLSRELQKRVRHKPVRQLVAEMGMALMNLTPCLMMSPLSVAQYLPADLQAFDLVVFDEASQITVPDAIGAIARGETCIVVGDPRQMPPTRFFERGAEDDENEEARDLESILDEALAARVPHHRLTGHYRSRHESLICFSNHAYYRGTLVTYPSADTRETAVTFRRVDGVYAKGKARTNEIEAKAVVSEVIRRLRDPCLDHLSIGVVTLNSEQQRLIEDLLDQERRAFPELERFFGTNRQEPVFVKNLETVQGDQRDVILLSIGYGPTEPGAKTMSMNFGPLNRQGGERRLNVAITRATTEVVVFASFDASMIDLTRTSAEAVRDLKYYIDFAARGPVALGEAIRSTGGSTGYDNDFEMAIAERLRTLGWTIRTQIGVSKFRIDLGIVHPDTPGRFLAGVECDGASYHGSPSARDRDRVRHIILEQLGWRLFRVWSTDFFLDPDASMSSLDSKLRALLEADRAAAEEAAAAAAVSDDTMGLPQEETEDEFRREDGVEGSGEKAVPSDRKPASANGEEDQGHVVARELLRPVVGIPPLVGPGSPSAYDQSLGKRVGRSPTVHGTQGSGLPEPDPTQFYEASYQSRLKTIAAAMIDAEGPITFKRLSDRIARAHGFQRTGRQISNTIWSACAELRQHVATPDDHKVFWPDGASPETVVPFRGLVIDGETREWREVPYPEKLDLVRRMLDEGSEDPARAIADAIGIARVTSQFRAEIAEFVRALGGG